MTRSRVIWTTVAALVALAFAGRYLTRASWPEAIEETLLPPLAAVVLTMIGPAALFVTGVGAWKLVAGMLTLIGVCLALARLSYRRSPQTEWFAAWLATAVLVWAGSGWLLVLLAF